VTMLSSTWLPPVPRAYRPDFEGISTSFGRGFRCSLPP
jgi:hypothetical protein